MGSILQREMTGSWANLVEKCKAGTAWLVYGAHDGASSGRQNGQLVTNGLGHKRIQPAGGFVRKHN